MRKAKAAAVPRPGEGKRGIEGYLGYLLRQAAAAHRLRMERALADLGVTAPQFMVLTMLNAYPGASGAELARLALVTPQTVSVIIANLERAGAIARRRHRVHGRIQHIDLTEAGHALLARCRERSLAVEAQIASGLAPKAEQAIRAWLVRVAVQDGAAGPDPARPPQA